MIMSRALRLAILALSAPLSLTPAACSTWTMTPLRPIAAESEQVGRARVVLRDGSKHYLDDVVVGIDSVVGFASRRRVAFPIRDVAKVERGQFSAWRTVAMVAATPAVIVGLWWLAYYVECSTNAC